MNKFIHYMIKFSSITALSTALEIYVKGPEMFFSDIFGSFATILAYYFISWFIVNMCKTIFFYGFGKISGLRSTFLNFFPVFVKRGSFSISFSLLDLFKLPNTYEFLGEDIQTYKSRVTKIKRIQSNLYILMSIFLLIFAIFFKVSIFIFIFSIIYLNYILNDYLDPGYKDEMIFDELVFSKNVNEAIVETHITYLYNNEKLLLTNPELLNNLNKLLLSCFNSNDNLMECILKLDILIDRLLAYPAREIAIACRGLIFDYIEVRISLSILNHCSIDGMKSMLNSYISKEWDINLPTPYLKKYKRLKGYLNDPTQVIDFQNGFKFLYLNSNNTEKK